MRKGSCGEYMYWHTQFQIMLITGTLYVSNKFATTK